MSICNRKLRSDGYTLLLATTSNAINATLYDRLNFNFVRDIAPVASVYRQPLVMEVHPAFPATTVAEFVAYAKANPGKINMASVGAPRGTPAEIIDKLNSAINDALADVRTKARFAELGVAVAASSPTDFGKFIASDTEKWAKVVKFAGLKAD